MPLRAENHPAPVVIPASAFAGVNSGGNPESPDTFWMPACAGMTEGVSVFVSGVPGLVGARNTAKTRMKGS